MPAQKKRKRDSRPRFEELPEQEEEETELDAGGSDGAGPGSSEDEGRPQRKKKQAKQGGFAAFGLSHGMLKSISKKGYKLPTPIQRKAVPLVLEGRDVVGMARTGSGKTAAFVIPMVERLKAHSAQVGARGLILSPSRELALQTLKVVKELSKHTDLRSCMLVGGDGMEEQFAALATNPDIIVATPGRFMHLIIEMNLDLKTVEYVVFDEADRLFELGFSQQLTEILHKLPPTRQTLLFSATLPKILADFAKAGLNDPTLVRLDLETKVSPDLECLFLSVPPSSRAAVLVYLLRYIIPESESTIVFVSTKHHVELLQTLLGHAGVSNSYIYGSLDQTARKANLARFRQSQVRVLIVTDVAARGVDIPLLDNVINYDFPPSSKTFVHRVGRVARAGRRGRAFSLVSPDEVPFFVDLQLFLGRRLVHRAAEMADDPDYTQDLVIGTVPQSLLDQESEYVLKLIASDATLSNLVGVAGKAYGLYVKTRPAASKESFRRAKEMKELPIHPLFREKMDAAEQSRIELVSSISKFRPAETVFEIGKRGTNQVMANRRKAVSKVIGKAKAQAAEAAVAEEDLPSGAAPLAELEQADPAETAASFRDPDFYLSYSAPDADTERGYAMAGRSGGGHFADELTTATTDLVGDDLADPRARKGKLVWDKAKKNFVRDTVGSDNVKRIRTESGQRVPASFKSNRFAEWQKKTKIALPRSGERELDSAPGAQQAPGARKYRHNKVWAPDPNSKRSQARKGKGAEAGERPASAKRELRTAQEIMKQRKLKEKRREKTGRHGNKAKKGGKPGGGKPFKAKGGKVSKRR
ncbi:ATP-dependent RNA helicase DBP10 [Hyaloraphidium curvatum]|nr:ATP-dependent RNA helicase DBP10 [Hyaloraphidium curvatum]